MPLESPIAILMRTALTLCAHITAPVSLDIQGMEQLVLVLVLYLAHQPSNPKNKTK